MLRYVIRRLTWAVPITFVASFIVFILVASSGDPLAELRGNPRITTEVLALREAELGLNDPLFVRYWDWLSGVLSGDLGKSAVTGEPVTSILWRRLAVTGRLIGVSMVVGVVMAVIVGTTAALRHRRWWDNISAAGAFIVFSLPVFWVASVLKDLAVRFNDLVGRRVFFTLGEVSANSPDGTWNLFLDRVGHLILPVATLAIVHAAAWSRYHRAAVLDALESDHVLLGTSTGIGRVRVVVNHVLRNALVPLVTIVAVDVGVLIGGAVITETVFSWKGMGLLLVESVKSQDVAVVQGWLLVASIAVIVFNLIADVLYGILDPRVRSGGSQVHLRIPRKSNVTLLSTMSADERMSVDGEVDAKADQV